MHQGSLQNLPTSSCSQYWAWFHFKPGIQEDNYLSFYIWLGLPGCHGRLDEACQPGRDVVRNFFAILLQFTLVLCGKIPV
jgi:hypothetical protein